MYLYEIVYNFCMMLSIAIEIYLAFDFFKSFHKLRPVFKKQGTEPLFGIAVFIISTSVHLMYNNLFNCIETMVVYMLVALILVEGNLWEKVFHWLLLILICTSTEVVLWFLMGVSAKVPTHLMYKNETVMISCMIILKAIQFMLLLGIKQISRINSHKITVKTFNVFIIIPVATFAIMFVIPYVYAARPRMIGRDIVMLLSYFLLLVGNISLFYVFTRYSRYKEEQALQEMSRIKYEERKQRYVSTQESDATYKERMHNIKYYLKQIRIYLDSGEYQNIADILDELQVRVHKEQEEMLCSNKFLNALLIDFREIAKKDGVNIEIFVEPGFNIEYMKEIDLTAVLGNLLDNALEAAKKRGDEGRIYADLYMANNGALTVFRIANNYQGEIKKKDGRLLTTKKDTDIHGIGIHNVERIVSNYSGYINQDYEDGIYVTTVIMPADSNKSAKIDPIAAKNSPSVEKIKKV